MAYQALARKWRPRTFTDVVGQEHVVKALTHALESDRMHHAYLFTGTRGVGKTTLGRILAKAVNCENRQGYDPCGQCDICREVDEGRFIDLIEVDAASRTKVEDTRDLLENVQYAPSYGRYKVYLIDEVHMLSGHSFNALLKTLEEPPPHVKFLLATTDPQKIPVTVLSRCLQFNLRNLTPEQIRQQMELILHAENIAFEQNALRSLARAADGSMRDGLTLLDQAIAHGGGVVEEALVAAMLGTVSRTPVFALLRAVAAHDAEEMLRLVADLAERNPNFADVLQQMLITLHHVALAQWSPESIRHDDEAEDIARLAHAMSAEEVQLFYQIGLIAQRDLALTPDPRSGFEMSLLRMLAFRPVQRGKGTEPDPRQPASPKPVSRPAPTSAHKPNVIAEAPAGAPEPLPVVSPPSSAHQSWPGIIKAMNLGGLTLQLANHCALIDMDDKSVTLALDPQAKQLRTPQLEGKLEDALRKHFGKPVRLSFNAMKPEQETPALAQQRSRDERQKAAELEIEQDENIRALKAQFNARIIPGSTKPID